MGEVNERYIHNNIYTACIQTFEQPPPTVATRRRPNSIASTLGVGICLHKQETITSYDTNYPLVVYMYLAGV